MSATKSSVSRVPSSITAVELAAVRPGRKGLLIVNDSTADLFVKFGDSGGSSTDFTLKLAAGQLYEMLDNEPYTGAIRGVWSAAIGAAQVTETML